MYIGNCNTHFLLESGLRESSARLLKKLRMFNAGLLRSMEVSI